MRKPAVASYGATGLTPLVSTIVLAIVMLLPNGTGLSTISMPHLVLISTFYWLSNRPLLMPYGVCALLGLFLDLWLDVPLGLNMLTLVLVRLFVLNQLKYYRGRSRLLYWGIFALISFALYVLMWILVSVVNGRLWPVEAIAFEWLITAFSYAPVAFILGRTRRLIM